MVVRNVPLNRYKKYKNFIHITEHRVIQIETKHAPKPSQPEVVLSDGRLNFESVIKFLIKVNTITIRS